MTRSLCKGSIRFNKKAQGYQNIEGFCNIACAEWQSREFDYIWIDTCCIDKTNSAELSEAINSMYYWYGKSEICYAFLNDIPPKSERKQNGKSLEHFIKNSVWFTRG